MARSSAGGAGAKPMLYAAIAAGFAAMVLFIGQAWLLAAVVDRVFLQRQGLAEVTPLLLGMLGLIVLRSGCLWGQEVLAQRAGGQVKRSLRSRLAGKLFALGPAYTRAERTGELVSTLGDGVEQLDDYITQFLPARALAVVGPLLVLAVILWLDPLSSLVLLFAGPMLILLLALIGSGARQITQRRFRELSWMGSFFLDILQGLTTLKLFGRSKEQATLIEAVSARYGNTTMEVLATAFQTSLVMEWAATAATAMVALEISVRLMAGQVAFQPVLAVLLLTPEFFMPLRQLAIKYHAEAAGKAAAERVFAILDEPAGHPVPPADLAVLPAAISPAPAQPAAEMLSALPVRFDLAFTGVAFAYAGGERPALRNFALAIPQGQTVALVGPTGAGKTTVANLLLRFLEPDAGTITAGGVSIGALDPHRWRTQVAWVPQAPHLFAGSVADNVRLARPDAGMEAVVAAAQAANAHEFILGLPRGYETLLGEQGLRLSGGQRQRLALARAFLKDAPVVVLDEATAHLDAESEALLQDALARLLRGRTVLLIAHRLKLVYRADKVALIEAGRVVAEGTHHALLEGDAGYRQLVATYEAGYEAGYRVTQAAGSGA